MKGLLFTYITTYGGAIAALFWPYYGLLIYICFAIVKPEAMWYWAVPAGNYSRIIAIAMMLGWAGSGFGKWNFGRASLSVYALLAWYSWGILTSALASDSAVAWGWVESMFKIVLPVMVGVTIIGSVAQLKQVAWVIVGSLGYVAYELNLSYLNGFNRLVTTGFGGMDNNTLSIAMVCGAGLAFFLGLFEESFWRRWLAFVCAGMMAHVPMFAESRGGMLALIVTGACSFALIGVGRFRWLAGKQGSPLRTSHYWFFGLAVLAGLYLAGPSVWQRFNTIFLSSEERDASAESRIVLWGQCWKFMISEPIFGIGPNHFPILIAPEWGGKAKEAHSLWMQTGAEMGFPGLIFLATFYGSMVWQLLKLIRSPEPMDPWFRDAARMVVAAIIGFAMAACFVTVEGVEPPYYVAMLGIAVLKLANQPAPVATAKRYLAPAYTAATRGLT